MVAWLAAVAVLLACQSATAQDDGSTTQWEMTLGMGIEEVASRDEAGSPLAYTGVGYPLVLRVEADRKAWRAGGETGAFVFGVNGGRLATAYAEDGDPSHRADSVVVDLSAWLDREVLTIGDHRVAVGGQLSHWTFFRTYLYNPAQIGSVETWEATISADLRAGLDAQQGRWSWGGAISVPLLGWVMRPSYAVRGDERVQLVNSRRRVLTQGRLTSVHRLQMVQAEAVFGVEISPRWAIGGQYRIGRLSYTNQVQTRAFKHRGMLGISYRF